jgi:flagellar hook-basal body complex protein FliE
MDGIGKLQGIPQIGELEGPRTDKSSPSRKADFGDALRDAISSVDRLQHDSEAAQTSFARGEDVDLHDVLIKVEEAEVAFKTMMEVRNKLVDAYREIMRLGA